MSENKFMEWQDISTAPKDGREILVLINHGDEQEKLYDYQIMSWNYGDWKIFCAHGNKSSNGTPELWTSLLPLPSGVNPRSIRFSKEK